MTTFLGNLLRTGGALAIVLSVGCGDASQPEPSAMAAGALPAAMDQALTPGDANAPLDRTVNISTDRVLGNGVTMHIGGTVAMHRAAPDARTVEVDVDLTREIARDGAAAAASGHLTGHVSVAIGEGGVRTLTGQLAASFESPRGSREGTITLAGLVQDPRDACQWPVGGSIARASGDQTHDLVFDGACGKATLDGEPVDLSELSSRGGRGGHRGRPF